jgi:hypothetical protein
MNWKKRAQSSDNSEDDLKDVVEELFDKSEDSTKDYLPPIKGYRPSEFSIPTAATEPEHIKTQEREKKVALIELRVSKYYSPHISEHIHHCIDSTIDSIVKLSKAFYLGRFVKDEIFGKEETRDEIAIISHRMLRAKIVYEILDMLDNQNKWNDREVKIISKARTEELKKVFKEEQIELSKIIGGILERISSRTKKKNELLSILEIIKQEFINSLIHRDFNHKSMEDFLYEKRSFK